MIYIHYSTLSSWWCLMCQWICYCFSDGTTERWIQRQTVRSWLKWCLDPAANILPVRLNLNTPKYKPFNCGLTDLVSSCTAWNPHRIYCSWQHWLCLHAWSKVSVLLMRLFWFCVDSWKCQKFQLGLTWRNLFKTCPLLCMVINRLATRLRLSCTRLILYM